MTMHVFGLIGNPVGHSLSSPMHEAAYEELGMEARYVTFEPDPGAAVDAVEGAAALGVDGLNVTIPFKRDVLAAVDPDDRAARIGAVNTVDLSTSPPRGYNTDAAGVRRALGHHGVDPSGDAVVVGAGGAGRAVAFTLAESCDAVHIANRTAERAASLATDVRDGVPDGPDGGAVTAGGINTLADRVPEATLLVNATSVGMEKDETPVPADLLHTDLAVLDAVYSPVETRLLRDAAAAGATTVDGGWMLLFQGVEAFERWTGRDAPVEIMNETLRSHL
jgi:shikimate dehydrogenase